MPPVLTPKNQEYYEYLQVLRRIRVLDSSEFKHAVEKLKAKQTKYEAGLERAKLRRAEARRVRIEAERVRASARRTISWDNLADYVRSHVTDLMSPFTLSLQSALNRNITREFNFNNMYHFNSWYGDVVAMSTIADSGNYKRIVDVMENEGEDVFQNVIPTVRLVSGGCNHHTKVNVEKETEHYKLKLFNPVDKRNNCGFHILQKLLGKPLNFSKIRKEYGLASGVSVPVEVIMDIYKKNGGTKVLCIIDSSFADVVNKQYEYIYIEKNHYYYVESSEYKKIERNGKHIGELYWDIETRETSEFIYVGEKKAHMLKDTILCAYYRRANMSQWNQLTFISGNTSSCRQFLDWLSEEANGGHFYTCYAHNGSRFDMYFLFSYLTALEQLHTETQLRGYSIIGAEYKGHMFKDTCCFLTNSLDNLCKAFKVKQSKLTSFEYNGEVLSNKNMCFYKPELNYESFMKLQDEEPEFWKLYVEYCMYDCIGLAGVWTSFTKEYNTLVEKIFIKTPEMLEKVRINCSNTIGSSAKKILEATCMQKVNGKFVKTSAYKNYLSFMMNGNQIDDEKVLFINKLKRGGISHTNQAGKHTHGLISYDIASQYPASMMYMSIPAGQSEWVTSYNKFKYGYYELTDLKFSSSYSFKPVSSVNDNGVLVWNNESIDSVYLDSFMISYLKEHYGLESFNVVKGLVSSGYISGNKLFGNYIDVMYQEKKKQDYLKSNNDAEYNPALRECIKLFLNSLSGKLVEDPSRYFKLTYSVDTTLMMNGIGAVKTLDDKKLNTWVSAGVMVYSYSKRLLFEYVRMLPNNSDDVIHIETDSIYMNRKNNDLFIQNINDYTQSKSSFYPIAIGSELGNVKVEKNTDEVSYFLGKKFYCIGDLYKIKGIPLKTIDDAGNDINLVDESLYEDVYSGKTVAREFKTMKKVLFGEKTYIAGFTMSRTIRPAMEYKLWE